MILRTVDRLDAYGTDKPGFGEGHPEDRCPLCERPVVDHVTLTRNGFSGLSHPAKWPHRRAALRDIIVERIDRRLS